MSSLGREVWCVLENFNLVVIGDKNHISWFKDTTSERNFVLAIRRKQEQAPLETKSCLTKSLMEAGEKSMEKI